MRAGELRHEVILEKKDETPNAAGGLDDTFTVVDTVYGKVEAQRGGRYVYGEQVDRVSTHQVTIRHRDDFRDGWDHLQIDGIRYRVHQVQDPDGRREQLVLQAEEIEAAV